MSRRREGRDHYDRPSWSEIDKRRGKKGTAAPSRPPPEPNRYQQKVMDEKFHSLFVDPKKEAALKKVREEVGKEGFVAALDAYHASYGLPDEYDLLQVVLEAHHAPALRVAALERMDQSVDAQAESTRTVFRSRVKLLALTAREPAVKKAASRIAKARGF